MFLLEKIISYNVWARPRRRLVSVNDLGKGVVMSVCGDGPGNPAIKCNGKCTFNLPALQSLAKHVLSSKHRNPYIRSLNLMLGSWSAI